MNIKKVIIAIITVILMIIGIICLVRHNNYKKNNPDVSNAKKAVVTNSEAYIYAKPKEKKKIEDMKLGENVYVLETVTENIEGTTREWYKVREIYEKKNKNGEVKKTYNRVGYILKNNVKYFEPDESKEYVLMSDVSKFDTQGERFKTAEDYEVFLLNSKINYAYIRIGGRGYGSEGNFYTDPNYQIYIDACDYLGVPYGFYYIDEAKNEEELDEEVEFVKKFVDENKGSRYCLPVCIDVEKYGKEVNARTKDIWEERGDLLQKLTEKFKEQGIDTIIYSNGNMASEYLDLVDADFWVAYYDREDKVPTTWVTDIVWETEEPSDEENENDENSDENNDENEESEEKEDEEEEEDDAKEKFKFEHFTENEELMPKVVAWQFTDRGVKKEGITLKVDLSLVKNEFFKSFVNK